MCFLSLQFYCSLFLLTVTLLKCGEALEASLQTDPTVKIDNVTAKVGQTITCAAADADDASSAATMKPSYSFEWQSSSSETGTFQAILGANKSTYVLTSKEAHKWVKCRTNSNAVTGEGGATFSSPFEVVDSLPMGKEVSFFGSNLGSFLVFFGLESGSSDADEDIVTEVTTTSVANGSLGSWTCSEGLCTNRFSPTSSLKTGDVIFKFKVKNAYGTQAEWAEAKVSF